MDFPQLTTFTSYSLLQSTIQISEYVQMARQKGYHELGLTDSDNLYGALEFVTACQKAQIKPILGLDLHYRSTFNEKNYPIFLFAKNDQGYQQLMRLSSQKMITETVALTNADQVSELFAILPIENELMDLLQDEGKAAETCARHLCEIFSEGSLFYGVPYQQNWSKEYAEWMARRKIRPAAYHLIDSLQSEEALAVEVMTHIKDGTKIADLQELRRNTSQQHFLEDAKTMQRWYQKYAPKALAGANMIAQNCHATIKTQQTLLPHFPVKERTAADFLQELCETELPKRVPNFEPRYQERLEYELSVIHKMGFDDYFLIVWDVMAFAHQQKIVTGAGRGSAAGSLVAYVLAITDVDPIKYDLLFERFLNPERQNMPDIDLDIPDNRRGEMLQYVKEKYGQNHVAQIATFGTMAAKMALRDVGRVFGISQSEANRWSKAIPNELKITLTAAYEKSKTLRELVAATPKNELMFQIAKTLEGLPRHVSTHAAGVVICDKDLFDIVPLQAGSEGILLTQFTMTHVEALGLLKMDFLGLRNLAIIDDSLKGIRQLTKTSFTQADIPLNDPATLVLFQKGETSGVFQFESAGIRNVLRRLHPENIDDIAAVNALYRPGPMQNIDHFIRRKHGQEKIDYPDVSLKPILENTYGIIVYQEQVMQVASQMAGFSLGQADILRRAVSKKKKADIDQQRENFVNGSLQKGHSLQTAEQVYDYIERFANYGFNRSHAYAYSFVAFQMGYLKVHYPAPFFKALLQSVQHNPGKVKEYMNEAEKGGLKILSPAINHSGYRFGLASMQEIRFGLGSIKGIRRDFVYAILEDRRDNGAFSSFNDFLYRMNQKDSRWLNESLLEPLIMIGAFDEIEANRRQLQTQLQGKVQNILYSGGSFDLMEMMELKKAEVVDYSLKEKLALEEKYLGVYLSGHPVQSFPKLLKQRKLTEVAELLPNQKAEVLLFVTDIREIRTKKGEQMAFLEGNDPSGDLSVTIFPELYRQVRQIVALDTVLLIEGKVETSKFNGELQLLARRIRLASEVEKTVVSQTCYLRFSEDKDEKELSDQLRQVIQAFPGKVPVILYFAKNKQKKLINETNWVAHTPESQAALENVFGKENVVFKQIT